MIKNFRDLFRKKNEDAMQERAETSRKDREIVDHFETGKHSLDQLLEELEEITKKKNHG